jgi:hypothetical protein
MGWVIFFAGLIAWATCPSNVNVKAPASSPSTATAILAVVWGAWALVVIAMIAGLVIVEVQP